MMIVVNDVNLIFSIAPVLHVFESYHDYNRMSGIIENQKTMENVMENEFFSKPILNAPYEYPSRHWELDDKGQPTHQIIGQRRRAEFITPIPKPKKRKDEAVETAIWLTEVAPKRGKTGSKFLNHLDAANQNANPELMRLALKLATGAGKTTVMAMIIAWQTVNAVRRPNSKTFSRGFLIVTPGITIRDRLRVLQAGRGGSALNTLETEGQMLTTCHARADGHEKHHGIK